MIHVLSRELFKHCLPTARFDWMYYPTTYVITITALDVCKARRESFWKNVVRVSRTSRCSVTDIKCKYICIVCGVFVRCQPYLTVLARLTLRKYAIDPVSLIPAYMPFCLSLYKIYYIISIQSWYIWYNNYAMLHDEITMCALLSST